MPQAKDPDIRRVYKETYDKDPVLTQGPDFDTFWKRVHTAMPQAIEKDARRVYDETYGTSVLTGMKRAVPRGFGALSSMAGAGLHFAGAEETGADVYEWGKKLTEEYPPSAAVSSEIRKGFLQPDTGGFGMPGFDVNTSLLRPGALVPGVVEGAIPYLPQVGAMAVGMAAGQPWLGFAAAAAMAGTEGLAGEYMENALKGDVDRIKGAESAAAVGLLNVLPIARIPGVGPLATKAALKMGGNKVGKIKGVIPEPARAFAARGTEEAITETLEEAVDPLVYGRYAEIPGAVQQATSIMPATFVLGGGAGMVGRGRTPAKPTGDDQLNTLANITEGGPRSCPVWTAADSGRAYLRGTSWWTSPCSTTAGEAGCKGAGSQAQAGRNRCHLPPARGCAAGALRPPVPGRHISGPAAARRCRDEVCQGCQQNPA